MAAAKKAMGRTQSSHPMPPSVIPAKKTATSAKKTATPAKKTATPAKKTATLAKKDQGACFVMCPFGGWHDTYTESIFRPAIQKAGLSALRADDPFTSSNIVNDIWHMILEARVLLADLTGKNPNVFYELGLAHAARKPVVLVTQEINDVPFDLRALRVIVYDLHAPDWGAKLGHSITTALVETLQAPESAVLPSFLLEVPAQPSAMSAEDRRNLELQAQIDSLRAEVRSSRRGDSLVDVLIGPEEARAMITGLQAQGFSRSQIVKLVMAAGAPQEWVEHEVRRTSRQRPHSLVLEEADLSK